MSKKEIKEKINILENKLKISVELKNKNSITLIKMKLNTLYKLLKLCK